MPTAKIVKRRLVDSYPSRRRSSVPGGSRHIRRSPHGLSELVHGFCLYCFRVLVAPLELGQCSHWHGRCCARRARSSVWVSSCAAGRQDVEHVSWSNHRAVLQLGLDGLMFLSHVSLQSTELNADASLRLCRRPLPLHLSSPDAGFPRGRGQRAFLGLKRFLCCSLLAA